MNGYNFTERVRRVLQQAREEALELRHEYVGTEHLLLGLLEGGGVAEAALVNLGVDPVGARDKILAVVTPGTSPAADVRGSGILGAIVETMGRHRGPDLPYTSRAKKVLELAMSEARDLNHAYVGTEHLLLGVLREERGIGAQVLTSSGVALPALRAEIVRLLGTEVPVQDRREVSAPRRPPDLQAAITLVVEHPDGRMEAKKFRSTNEAVRFLNGLES